MPSEVLNRFERGRRPHRPRGGRERHGAQAAHHRRCGTACGRLTYLRVVRPERPSGTEETKQRILAAAAELGWTPSRPARALSLGKAGAFGLVLAREPEDIGTDLFFPAFIAGVEVALGERGDGLMVHLTTPDRERSVYERLAADRRVWTACS
ncbi:LacI family DNA-binding transcriptional regulator [Streptomyces tendae]|uniref:hypothetical protein n=1 Tax=Streptomyces tendae TaxID=1932 RepID=UPI003719B0A5